METLTKWRLSEQFKDDSMPAMKRRLVESSRSDDKTVIDLTMDSKPSSPTPSRSIGTAAVTTCGSSPLTYGSEGEEEEVRTTLICQCPQPIPDSYLQLDKLVHDLQDRANNFRKAADLIEAQLKYRNRIWMKSVRDRDLGGDVHHFVTDIRQVEETGRTRDNTWGKTGDRTANRRMRNTMGYQTGKCT